MFLGRRYIRVLFHRHPEDNIRYYLGVIDVHLGDIYVCNPTASLLIVLCISASCTPGVAWTFPGMAWTLSGLASTFVTNSICHEIRLSASLSGLSSLEMLGIDSTSFSVCSFLNLCTDIFRNLEWMVYPLLLMIG